MVRSRHITAVLLVTLALAGAIACKLGPDYKRPEITVPDLWHAQAVEGVQQGEATSQTWWELLDDPLLLDLLKRAETANLDLEIALARIREARASVRINKGARWPEVDLQGDASIDELSETVVGAPTDSTENFFLGVGFSWELDVFGRVRRSIESAGAAFEASIEDYRDVLVVLMADVGVNYISAITLQERIRLTEENIVAQRESLQLTRDRFDAGLTSALDVAQAESNLANTEARIPLLEISLEANLNRLAVLLGENPGSLHDELIGRQDIPDPPDAIVTGIPADAMRQRPDIRRAERQLASQTALIGVAKADLYPRFSLTGLLGLNSDDIGDLFDGDSVTWSVGLPAAWNLFDGGSRRGGVQVQEARTEQQLSVYKLTVLVAMEEVENSLVAYAQQRARRDRLARAVDASQRSYELVRTQYLTGLTNFQNVLDTQRSLTDQQDQLADSEGQVIASLITLYEALGGGWAVDEENEETFTKTALE